MPQPNDIRNRLLVARLPALPQALIKLLALCQSDDVSMAELAKLISVEPALTSRLLSVANSAAFQRNSEPVDLYQAANVLGTELIKVLVISESVYQTFNAFSNVGGTDLRAFWKHALSTAIICRELARRLNYAQVDEAYLAGLLHDVGRLALLSAAPQHYQANFYASDDATLCEVEQQTLNISHTEAGAWLTRRWHLADHLVESILYHHEDVSLLGNAHPLIPIVHLAQRLESLAAGELTDDFESGLDLAVDDLAIILQNAQVQVAQTARDLGIDISGLSDAQTATAIPPVKPSADPSQVKLAQEIRDRTLLTEMTQTLTRQPSVAAMLLLIRQHANILLQLDDSLIMLMRDNLKTLVPVSMNDKVRPVTSFFAVEDHAALAECATHQNAVFISRNSAQDTRLLDMVAADHLVCIPLASAKRCLGILVASVPPEQLAQAKSNARLIQDFGLHAGTAMAQKALGQQEQRDSLTKLKSEQQINVKKMAHEVNNPIGVIKNYLEVIDEKLSKKEPVTAELSILGAEIDRVGSIVNNFSRVSRPPPFVTVDVNRLAREMVQLVIESRFFPGNMQISCRLPEQPCLIRGSADLIKQVLLNLIKNARECMPEGGRIVIGGGLLVAHDGKQFSTLSVTDTGPGLSAEVQAQLFKPLQSSKNGENRGLGLSIVAGLVQKMGGTISCKTGPTGTNFTLLLPSAAPTRVDEPQSPAAAQTH